jgi:hypothetical protein
MILIQGGSMVLTSVCLSLLEDETIATCGHFSFEVDWMDAQ